MRFVIRLHILEVAIGYPWLQNREVSTEETVVADARVDSGIGFVHNCCNGLLYSNHCLPYEAKRICVTERVIHSAVCEMSCHWGLACNGSYALS